MIIRKLHIAMVVRSFSPQGGLELYTYRLVQGLLGKGVRVTVICEEASDTLTHENLEIVRFAPARPGMRKAQRLMHYYAAASKAVDDHGPFDLVHSQQLPVASADVVTFHNHTLRRMSEVGTTLENLFNRMKRAFIPAYRLRNYYDRELCLRARCLVFPSQRCRDDYYQTFGVNGELARTPSVVAYAAANETSLDTPQEPDDSPTFLFIGKGYRTKGLNVLIQACRILAARGKNFKLLVVGTRARALDKMKLSLYGLRQKVTYLGFMNDLDRAFKQSQIYVMPSRMETFGIACIEAMQHGLAPIVSRVAGVSELLDHGRNALILENHLDAQALAELMQQLSDDCELRIKLGKAARQTALENTWHATVEATLQAYELAQASPANSPARTAQGCSSN